MSSPDSTETSIQNASVDLNSPDAVRSEMIRMGWRQGSLLPESLHAEVRVNPFATSLPQDVRFVVISQTCDLVHGSLDAEPAAEVIAGRRIDRVLHEKQHARNPRELHLGFRSSDGSEIPVAFRIWDRGFVDRTVLIGVAPDSSLSVPDDDLRVLIRFVARRYDRVAFPDEFLRRFDHVKDRIEKLTRKHKDDIIDIFLILEPFEELRPLDGTAQDKNYSVRVYVVVTEGFFYENPNGLKEMRGTTGQLIKKAIRECPGVDLDELLFISHSDLTLDIAGRMQPLDFTALSYELSAGPAAKLPSATHSQDRTSG